MFSNKSNQKYKSTDLLFGCAKKKREGGKVPE